MLLHADSQSLSLWRGKGVVILYGNRYTVFRAYLVDLLISLRVVYGGILSHAASSAGLISAIRFLPTLWTIIYGLVVYTKLHNFLYILYSA